MSNIHYSYTSKNANLVCANNIEFLREIGSNTIDLTLTSPPYDDLRKYDGYTFRWEPCLEELYRVTKDGGVLVWIVNDSTTNGSESGNSFRQVLYAQSIGYKIHDTMIWKKPGFTAVGSIKTRYAPVFEYMFILVKGKLNTFNPICDRENKFRTYRMGALMRQANGSMRRNNPNIPRRYGIRHNVWEIPPVMSNTERTGHPAQFPVRLAMDHILTWTNVGDVVLDPFVGSGSTIIAALSVGRISIGCDISAGYIEMAKNRIIDFTNSNTELFTNNP